MALDKLNYFFTHKGFISGLLMPRPYIGLDLGIEKLNMVQVDYQSGQPVIIAASSVYHESSYNQLIQDPKQFKELIKRSLKSAPFQGRNVVANLPSSLLKILFLNFQCKPNENEADALLNALKDRQHEKLDDYVIDYLAINPQLTEQLNRIALVAMAKTDDTESFLELLSYSGLSVEALEIGPVAIKRLISAINSKASDNKILSINFGSQKSYLTVVWNNELLLDREIDFGMDNILNAITKAFDITNKTALQLLHTYGLGESESVTLFSETEVDDNDDSSIKNALIDILRPCFFLLTEEIKEVLVYVASETRGGAVEQVYLLGSLARVSDIDRLIDRLISIPVRTINPFFGFEEKNNNMAFMDDLGPLAGVAVATGLSMRARS